MAAKLTIGQFKKVKNMLFGHNGIASKVFRTRKSLAAQGTSGRDTTDV
jgi:hypothetical protein